MHRRTLRTFPSSRRSSSWLQALRCILLCLFLSPLDITAGEVGEAKPPEKSPSYLLVCLKGLKSEVDWAIENLPEEANAEAKKHVNDRFNQTLDHIGKILKDRKSDVLTVGEIKSERLRSDLWFGISGQLTNVQLSLLGFGATNGPSARDQWKGMRVELDKLLKATDRLDDSP